MKKYIVFFFLVMLLMSCEKEYIIKNNSVYLKGWNEGNGNYERLVKNADAKTFENLKFKGINGVFGKDKKTVFFDGEIVENCDPKSFTFIGNYLFKDKDALFFFGFYSSSNDWRIETLNPEKARIFEYPWSTDGVKLLYGYKPVNLENIIDFKAIDKNWGKTKTKIIYENNVIKKADYETFEVLSYSLAKDKNHTYQYGKIRN